METAIATSDGQVLDLMRRNGAMSVTRSGRATRVTATAVRQRLTRLMGQGLVERELASADGGPCRPRAPQPPLFAHRKGPPPGRQ